MKNIILILTAFLMSASKIYAATDIDKNTYEAIYYSEYYTGNTINPSILLFVNESNKSLSQGTDYTLELKLNGVTVSSMKNAGTYQAIFTGINDYEGTKTVNLTVKPSLLSSVTVTGVNSSYPYSGSPVNPDNINVTLNGVTISPDDYTVTYGENTNIASGGTIKLTPSASNNFSGEQVISFAIDPVNLSNVTTDITLDPASYSYNGSAITPTIKSVTADGKTLTGSDYTVNVPQGGTNTNPGNGLVTISGTGNYTGTASQSFTITNGDLSGAVITLDKESYDYLGSPVKPSIASVTLNGRMLVADTDYTVNAPADGTNINVGEGTVSISGINNYIGSASKTFKINAIPLEGNMLVAIASQKHTGSAITLNAADITVTCHNTNILTLDTDYTIVGYENNTAVGEATVTLEGKGNFTGRIKGTYTIEDEPMTSDMFSVLVEKPFTGNAITLTGEDIKATDNNVGLKLGTDYEIQEYTANTNAGTATVVLKGIGNYSGTVPVTFTIAPASLTDNMFSIGDKTYTGSEVTLIATDITGTFNSVPLELGKDYTLSNYTANIEAGTASVTITGQGNFKDNVTVNFNIIPAPLNAHMFTVAKKAYTGNAIEPAGNDITATNGEKVLVAGTDYSVESYANNTNAGTATVTFKGTGNYSGSVPVDFTITPATLTADMFTAIAGKVYTGIDITLAAADITSSLKPETDYSIGYYLNNSNAGTASVVFNGTGNYTGTTTPVNFTITPATLSANMVTVAQQYYSGNPIHPQPTVKLGNVEMPASAYTVSYPDTQEGAYIQPGTYSIKVDAVANGNLTGSATATFKVIDTPVTYYTVTIPSVKGITTNPDAGTYNVTRGNYFTFYITRTDISKSQRSGMAPCEDIIVKVNGVEMHPVDMGNNMCKMTINDIEENINVEITLLKDSPVDNLAITTSPVKVYSVNSVLYIETGKTAMVDVFAITGRSIFREKVESGITSIPSGRGIYIVKVDKEIFKVIVR